MGVLNSVELTGVSRVGWKEAADEAVAEAARTLRNLRRLVVLRREARMLADGSGLEYRTRVRLFFELERPSAITDAGLVP